MTHCPPLFVNKFQGPVWPSENKIEMNSSWDYPSKAPGSAENYCYSRQAEFRLMRFFFFNQIPILFSMDHPLHFLWWASSWIRAGLKITPPNAPAPTSHHCYSYNPIFLSLHTRKFEVATNSIPPVLGFTYYMVYSQASKCLLYT